MKVFVSYSWKQSDWVWRSLVPCLRAGGCEVILDKERMQVGGPIFRQTDLLQDQADKTLFVLSPDYFASLGCQHEMERGLAKQKFLPCYRLTVPGGLPAPFDVHLVADLRDDQSWDDWNRLMLACEADLGVTAPEWLNARDEVASHLKELESVNLVVSGTAKWRALIDHIAEDELAGVPGISTPRIIDLNDGRTSSEAGLVRIILEKLGSQAPVNHQDALAAMTDTLVARQRLHNRCCLLVLLHFDNVRERIKRGAYTHDLFNGIRFLAEDQSKERKPLVLLIQSRESILELVPQDNAMSGMRFQPSSLGR